MERFTVSVRIERLRHFTSRTAWLSNTYNPFASCGDTLRTGVWPEGSPTRLWQEKVWYSQQHSSRCFQSNRASHVMERPEHATSNQRCRVCREKYLRLRAKKANPHAKESELHKRKKTVYWCMTCQLWWWQMLQRLLWRPIPTVKTKNLLEMKATMAFSRLQSLHCQRLAMSSIAVFAP